MTMLNTRTQARGREWQGAGSAFALVMLGAYAIIGSIAAPEFLSKSNIITLLFTSAILLPVTLGTQALLLIGRFDLSLGAQASLYGMIAGLLFALTGSATLSLAFAMCCALAVGFVNGYLIAEAGLNQLVVTLAMMGIIRSMALLVNDGRILTSIPPEFGLMTAEVAAGVPLAIILAILLLMVADFAFKNLVICRRLYAVGGNAAAADRSGIRVDRVTVATYCAAALAAAVVGIMQSGRTLSASPLLFQGLAIDAIAACLIGGSTMLGGRGSMVGAAIGLLAVVATRNLILILGVSVYWRDLAVGVLLITAVFLQWSLARRFRLSGFNFASVEKKRP